MANIGVQEVSRFGNTRNARIDTSDLKYPDIICFSFEKKVLDSGKHKSSFSTRGSDCYEIQLRDPGLPLLPMPTYPNLIRGGYPNSWCQLALLLLDFLFSLSSSIQLEYD